MSDNFDFISAAHVTLSPSFHADKVPAYALFAALSEFIAAAERLDKMKKSLFYGRDLPEEALGDPIDQFVGEANTPETHHFDPDILHGIIGIATEAGELVEALVKATFSPPGAAAETFDLVNMAEEVGDVFWYQAILARKAGMSFDQIQRMVIDKLRLRFGDKFTEYDANNRNLDAERQLLDAAVEGGINAPVTRINHPHFPALPENIEEILATREKALERYRTEKGAPWPTFEFYPGEKIEDNALSVEDEIRAVLAQPIHSHLLAPHQIDLSGVPENEVGALILKIRDLIAAARGD